MNLVTILALLFGSLIIAAPVVAQDSSPTPGPATPLASQAAETIIGALTNADAPQTLPGNTDHEIVLDRWESFYGESLDATQGAWVMTGSNELPMASVLVFESPDAAFTGLGEFRANDKTATAGPLDAWTIADRGKWVCMAVDGPVLIIGQAEPESTDEDQDMVRDRACDVTAEVHSWMLDLLNMDAAATPDV